MKRTITFAGLAAVAAVAVAAFALPQTKMADKKMDAKRTPVVVELFTSEGCSSCPPADANLAKLAREMSVPGAEIIPLSIHVDYWNSIGWKDPYSTKALTARQSEYATWFKNDQVYTPQMIVDGRTEFVGGDLNAAKKAIESAAKRVHTPVNLSANLVGTTLRVTANTGGRTAGDKTNLFVAVTENELSQNVSRGENAGRHLTHHAVTRLLKKVPAGGDSIAVTIPAEWKRENLRVVAFLQNPSSGAITGAATTGL